MGLLDKNKKTEIIRSYRGHNFEIVNLECEAMGIKDMDDNLFVQMFNRYPIETFIKNTIPGYGIKYDDMRFKMIQYMRIIDETNLQIFTKVMTHDYHFTFSGEGFEFYVGIDEGVKCDY